VTANPEPRTFVTSRTWDVDDDPLDDEQRGYAIALIRDLAAVAGDEDEVLAVLGGYARDVGLDQARRDLAAAVFVLFADLMSHPATPDQPVLVPIP
jgi:hypothetical protein